MKEHNYYVYMLASKKNGTLYIGVTGNLRGRIYQHRDNKIEGFTKKYSVHNLVYFERFESVEFAIQREKELKRFRRQWKIGLIEKDNSEWKDLYEDLS